MKRESHEAEARQGRTRRTDTHTEPSVSSTLMPTAASRESRRRWNGPVQQIRLQAACRCNSMALKSTPCLQRRQSDVEHILTTAER